MAVALTFISKTMLQQIVKGVPARLRTLFQHSNGDIAGAAKQSSHSSGFMRVVYGQCAFLRGTVADGTRPALFRELLPVPLFSDAIGFTQPVFPVFFVAGLPTLSLLSLLLSRFVWVLHPQTVFLSSSSQHLRALVVTCHILLRPSSHVGLRKTMRLHLLSAGLTVGVQAVSNTRFLIIFRSWFYDATGKARLAVYRPARLRAESLSAWCCLVARFAGRFMTLRRRAVFVEIRDGLAGFTFRTKVACYAFVSHCVNLLNRFASWSGSFSVQSLFGPFCFQGPIIPREVA